MQLEDVPPTNSASGASIRTILFSQRRLYRFQRPLERQHLHRSIGNSRAPFDRSFPCCT